MRWIVRIVGTLVALVVVAFLGLFFVPAEKIAQLAAERFERATGRSLTIEGDVRPTFWPVLGVTTGPVTVGNADWASSTPMFQAKALSIGVDASALIGGEVRVTEVIATAPQILLERAADGRGNWEMAGPSESGAGGAAAAGSMPLTLAQGTIREGRITFVDQASGQRFDLTELQSDFALPDWNGPAKVQMAGRFRDQDFKVNLTVAQAGPAMGGKLTAVEFNLTAGVTVVNFAGKAGLAPLMAEGKLAADLGNLAAVSRLAGMARPELPRGLGAELVRVAGGLTFTPEGTLHLRGASLTLDGNQMTGDLDYAPGPERPKINAKLSAGVLDLQALGGGGGAGGVSGGASSAKGWDNSPIDVSGLGAVDVGLALRAEGVRLGLVTLGATQASVNLDRSRAVIGLKQVSAYEGSVTGEVVVNGRGGLSVGGDVTTSGMAMQPLLRDLIGVDRLLAKGDLRLKFLSSGNSLAAIMAGLSGEGRLALGQGEIQGLDLAGMITHLDPGYVGQGAKTIFRDLKASFTIEGGVLSNKDMALNSPVVDVNGRGKVDLGARKMNYRVIPKAFVGQDGKPGLKVPVDIAGPWDNLKYKIDIQAATGVDVEEEAKKKVEEKLGIKRKKGESLEDAAKRKAEKKLEAEAKKALEGLLGGP